MMVNGHTILYTRGTGVLNVFMVCGGSVVAFGSSLGWGGGGGVPGRSYECVVLLEGHRVHTVDKQWL